jgi:hypothetical protein
MAKKEIKVGDKIDMLTVVSKYNATDKKGKEIPMCECLCECGGKTKKRESWLKRNTATLHSCGCKAIPNPNYHGKQEINEAIAWERLYEHVKTSIMGYSPEQALPSSMVLRLKGLTTGKYIENRNIPDKAAYTYNAVYLTFQYCFESIMRAVTGKKFKNEQAKFNYVMKIVESNLNNVFKKLEQAELEKQKIEQTNWERIAKYQNRFEPKKDYRKDCSKFDDLLWGD